MASELDILKNREKLARIFGEWPSFHDAEVLSIVMERDSPSLTLRVFVFQRGKIDKNGYFERLNKCIATLRFYNVREVEIADFNCQNVIDAIQIDEKQPKEVQVTIHSLFGLAGKFICSDAEVVDAERIVFGKEGNLPADRKHQT